MGSPNFRRYLISGFYATREN